MRLTFPECAPMNAFALPATIITMKPGDPIRETQQAEDPC
jgi:hypothetical protein